MRIFAIADPHLSKAQPKPMDIFGGNWEGHPDVFFERWQETVGDDDLVLIPGDISWAMRLEDALQDLNDIAALPGTKVLLRGNHDYWWSGISKVRAALPARMYAIQNDAMVVHNTIISGARGWLCPGSFNYSEQDEKIYQRERERLKLSLEHAKRLRADRHIIMMHYPPTNQQLEANAITELLIAAQPDAVVFGHVHGETAERVTPDLGDIAVHFVAADALKFRPKLIMDTTTP